jgi:hypothetical protein
MTSAPVDTDLTTNPSPAVTFPKQSRAGQEGER